MKRFHFLLLIFTATLFVVSCKKDFLVKNPETFISPELFFNSEQDLSMYINGLLNNPGTGTYLSDEVSDNAATTGSREGFNIMLGNITPQNTANFWTWERLRNINYFLVNYNKANVDQAAKNHYAGLARYYRALFYYDKVRLFSDVPWYSGILAPTDEELYKESSPRTVIVDSIMADLQFASDNVRENVLTSTPGKWVVKTAFARIALYEGTWRKYHSELNLAATANSFFEKAKTVANEVITSGKYSIPATVASYSALFNSQSLSGNSEVMLFTDYSVEKARTHDNNYLWFNNGEYYEMSPSKAIIQTYLMEDGSRYTDQAGYETFQFVKEFENRDPRLYTTIAYPGWEFRGANPARTYIQTFSRGFTGYHLIKGYGNTTVQNDRIAIDYPALRYAEVLLTYAEAAAELGDATQADIDKSINPLRRRAQLPDLNVATANGSPDSFLEAQYPNVTGAAKGLILEVRRERRVELAFEGYRNVDIMRWSTGKLMEKYAEGMYFPGLGKYDVTGDGVEDIKLIGANETIPALVDRESNSLGVKLVYSRAGTINESVTIALKNGAAGGNIVITDNPSNRTFVEPKYYYRPIPASQIILNPALKQPFGWQ